ncbi:MAG: choice-of-anchor L domain-containing protein [Bacteroidota bacterium]
MRFKKLIFLSVAMLLASTINAQLIVDSSLTPTQLVQNVLLGSGITVSNITYTGDGVARGSFDGSASNIGFTSGIILATGNISDAVGPNNSSWAGNDLLRPGDSDLDTVSWNTTYDAAILEFDFIPLSDVVKFRYAFGSEEYMEFVNAGVNDAFGFFVSGPGINGPYSNNSKNIALVPGKMTPVTIDSLNLNENGTYYFDNGNGNGTGTAPDGLSIQYDGFTVPLTATVTVQCGKTYHIKIAIADAGDGVWDSGVFLEAGTFGSSGETVAAFTTIRSQGIASPVLYEGCGDACITFVRNTPISSASSTYPIIYTGEATNGSDFNLPSSITFAPGEDTVTICFAPLFDTWLEGEELLELHLLKQGNCTQTMAQTTLKINECQVSIPNVISPDGNMINDKFIVHGSEGDAYSELQIFNRWGNKLYETIGYQNDWDGEKYSDGTYYYVYKTGDGRTFPGFFQIVRSQ